MQGFPPAGKSMEGGLLRSRCRRRPRRVPLLRYSSRTGVLLLEVDRPTGQLTPVLWSGQ
jgi:hypothetical protein